MSNVFVRRRHKLLSLKALRDSGAVLPGNTEENCPHCGQPVLRRELVKNQYVCPLCGYHHPIGAYYRLSLVLDEGSFKEMDEDLISSDPLEFPGYEAKLDGARRRTGLGEGVVTALGRIDGQKVAAGVLDSRFFMGSMSAALGEKVTRLVEYADKNKLPLILFSASGGARMHRADHRRKTARRLPDGRVPAGARLCGRHRPPGPAAQYPDPPAQTAWKRRGQPWQMS